jgi:hypothetical protein
MAEKTAVFPCPDGENGTSWPTMMSVSRRRFRSLQTVELNREMATGPTSSLRFRPCG